ncbi:MAG: DUF4256 domain-containing protein [Myxococcota bacterium]
MPARKKPAPTKARPAGLLETLKTRFEQHPHRHPKVRWEAVQARLEAAPDKLAALAQLEATGGAPDVLGGEERGGFLFVDFAPETPEGRRSLCYDDEALEARKANKPKGSAVGLARRLGGELLTEAQYAALQAVEPVDQKTSSWLATPEPVRALGGALFGDRRFGRVFTYHNGAESYYQARGFRCCLRV